MHQGCSLGQACWSGAGSDWEPIFRVPQPQLYSKAAEIVINAMLERKELYHHVVLAVLLRKV